MSRLTDFELHALYTKAFSDKSAEGIVTACVAALRAIEAAATEPLLQRIAELEEMNAQLREQNTEVDKACAELEAANEAFAQRQEWWNERMVELEQRNSDLHEDVQRFKKHALNEKAARLELERQLEEAQKDAERWKMTIEINQDVLRHPDSRKIPASVSAYMNAIHEGYDMTYAVDAAIDVAMQNHKPVGVVFQKGQS